MPKNYQEKPNNNRGRFRGKRHTEKREKPEYDQKLLGLDRVTRVVAGGRRFRFRAVVVIGNRNGKVGVGSKKGQDVSMAVEKAVAYAKKHLIEVPIVNGTIPHSTEAKFGSAKILLKPGIEGKGIVAGGAVRVVCDLVGIQNVAGKILGKTKNKLNNAQATIKALSLLRKPRKKQTEPKKKEEQKKGAEKK